MAVHWNRADRGPGLWLVSLEGTSQTFLCKGAVLPIEWSTDGKWIYASNVFETPRKIFKIPASGGELKTVATLPFEGQMDLAMTHDGKRFVCALSESVSDV